MKYNVFTIFSWKSNPHFKMFKSILRRIWDYVTHKKALLFNIIVFISICNGGWQLVKAMASWYFRDFQRFSEFQSPARMLIFSLQINLIGVFDLDGIDWLLGYIPIGFGTYLAPPQSHKSIVKTLQFQPL